MTPVIYCAEDHTPNRYMWVGMFMDDEKLLPMYFHGDCPFKLRDEMNEWLVKEREKIGLTAEMVERRKAALAAARAARKAKKEQRHD